MSRGFLKELKRRNVLKVAVGYLVAAWLIAQVVDLALESFTAPHWTMPAVLIALAVGFPVALAISWSFEVTTSGVVPETEIDRTVRITDRSGQRVDLVLLLIVAVVIVFMGLERFVFSHRVAPNSPVAEDRETVTELGRAEPASTLRGADRAGQTGDVSVAVLPFALLSTGPDDSYFADAVSETIIGALSQLPELRVTARSSSFGLRHEDLPAAESAGRLGVTHVVEGTVRRAGERLQVRAELIRANDGSRIWSESHDARTGELPELLTALSSTIATELGIPLDEGRRERIRSAGSTNINALIAYQKGLEYFRRAHREPNQISLLRQANVHFENAYQHAPELTDASARHADLYRHILVSHAAGELNGEITPRDVEAAPGHLAEDYERILRHARTPQQRLKADFERALTMGEWRRLAALTERVAAAPGCEAPVWLHLAGAPLGQIPPIQRAFERWRICDPLRTQAIVHTAGTYLWLARADRALATARSGLEHANQMALARAFALSLAFLERHEDASRAAASRIREDDVILQIQSILAAIRGDANASREHEARYLGRYGPNDRDTLVFAALRGERAEANRLAGLIDSRPLGHIVLLQATYMCMCGAPFDLDATPAFAERLVESSLDWPPASPYALPLKKW